MGTKDSSNEWSTGSWYDESYRWEIGLDEVKQWEEKRKKTAKDLKVTAVLLLILFVFGLGWLGFAGWGQAEESINYHLSATPTPTSTPMQHTATPGASVTPTPTASVSQAPTSAAQATSAGGQYYAILAILAGILVLLPTFIFFGFAIHQTDKLTKEHQNDLIKLGIVSDKAELELNRLKRLAENRKKIKETLSDGKDKKPQTLVSRAVDFLETWNPLFEDVHPKPPEGISDSKWESAKSLYQEFQTLEEKQAEKDALESRADKYEKLIAGRFGWYEYILPLIVLTLLLLVNFVWAFWPTSIEGFVSATIFDANGKAGLHVYFSDVIATMGPATVAGLTAYVFVAYQLVRRYHRYDITPGAFWEAVKRLLLAFLIGLVITAWSKADADEAGWLPILWGVLAGVFPLKTIGIIVNGAQAIMQARFDNKIKEKGADAKAEWGPNLSRRLFPRHELTMLDDLDEFDVERIEEEGAIGVQGLATCDIAQLVVWTPFPTSQIVDWVDQAILFLTTGAEPEKSYAKTFRTMGLRGATDLLDAANEPGGVKRIVSAAKAIGDFTAEDPISSAQLAALRASLKVKDAQEKIKQVSDNVSKDENKEKEFKDFKSDIESAVKLAQESKTLADTAQEKVKAGGDVLKSALDAATSLQARFKGLGEKAGTVTEKMKEVDDKKKLSELSDLKSAISTLNQETTKDPDAKSLAKTLVDALDKIEQPLMEVETSARGLEDQINSLKTSSDGATDPINVPEKVGKALDELKTKAENAQKFIKEDVALADVTGDMDKLVGLLTDDSDNKLKKLTKKDKVEKEEAAKLVELVKELQNHIKPVKEAIALARAKAAGAGTLPPLTQEVLEVLLSGMEKNANLRRVYRYLTHETMEISKPAVKYLGNAKFIDAE